ncbi:MAG: hypothetical protein Q4E62_06905, partial [Sutterellaceae bacterium]|nr:hypothetical protein [Sutterellaceae bacterium]
MRAQPQQTNFLKSLPIVAGCLGNKLGVRVELSNQACTNGKTIYVPMSIDSREIGKEELLGFIVHEASHVRYTKFKFKFQGIDLPIKRALVNAIEDARIEKLIGQEYAGAPYLLEQAHKPFLEKYLDPGFVPKPESILPMYCLLRCEATYNQSTVHGFKVYRQWFEQVFGSRLLSGFDKELDKFDSFKSTQQVANCAERLFELLENQLKQQAPDKSQNQSGSKQQGNQSQPQSGQSGQSASQSQGSNQSQASGDNSAAKETSEGSKPDQNANGNSGSGSSDGSTSKDNAKSSEGNSADQAKDAKGKKGKSKSKSKSESEKQSDKDSEQGQNATGDASNGHSEGSNTPGTQNGNENNASAQA